MKHGCKNCEIRRLKSKQTSTCTSLHARVTGLQCNARVTLTKTNECVQTAGKICGDDLQGSSSSNPGDMFLMRPGPVYL